MRYVLGFIWTFAAVFGAGEAGKQYKAGDLEDFGRSTAATICCFLFLHQEIKPTKTRYHRIRRAHTNRPESDPIGQIIRRIRRNG